MHDVSATERASERESVFVCVERCVVQWWWWWWWWWCNTIINQCMADRKHIIDRVSHHRKNIYYVIEYQ